MMNLILMNIKESYKCCKKRILEKCEYFKVGFGVYVDDGWKIMWNLNI